jgi:8-oxo-dGTP pyrophosphatase MutT (NUDIX family)
MANSLGFDPLLIPVDRTDDHLAPIPDARLSAQFLLQRFSQPPIWQPEILRERKFLDREPAQAAVLMGLVMRDEPTVLLTERTQHMSTHAGQIAFAGGKCDALDADAAATALREAYEEVGLESHYVQVLGELPIYITGSAFHVTPIVALIDPSMQLQINATEVVHAFEVPLAYLMNPANHRWHVWEFEGVQRQWLSMPYQDGPDQRYIWGATAGMLRNFYRFLQA